MEEPKDSTKDEAYSPRPDDEAVPSTSAAASTDSVDGATPAQPSAPLPSAEEMLASLEVDEGRQEEAEEPMPGPSSGLRRRRRQPTEATEEAGGASSAAAETAEERNKRRRRIKVRR